VKNKCVDLKYNKEYRGATTRRGGGEKRCCRAKLRCRDAEIQK
jgi:hypothetical protein